MDEIKKNYPFVSKCVHILTNNVMELFLHCIYFCPTERIVLLKDIFSIGKYGCWIQLRVAEIGYLHSSLTYIAAEKIAFPQYRYGQTDQVNYNILTAAFLSSSVWTICTTGFLLASIISFNLSSNSIT